MKRLGSYLAVITALLLLIPFAATAQTTADPDWAPSLFVPDDTTYQLCNPEEICFDISIDEVDQNDTLVLQVRGAATVDDTILTQQYQRSICFTPDTAGTYRFTYFVKDKQNHKVYDTSYVSVTFADSVSIWDQEFSDNACELNTLRRIYPDYANHGDEPVTFELISGPGSVSETGRIAYEITEPGTTVFELAIHGPCNSDTATMTDVVTLNEAPYLVTKDTTISLCTLEEICLPISATDPDGAMWELTQVGGPGEFTMIDSANGQTCFTPEYVDSATYIFVYCLRDNCFENKSEAWPCYEDTLRVTVLLNQAPTIVCPDPQTFFTCDEQTFCFRVYANDPDFDDLTYNVLSGNATVSNDTVCVAGVEDAQLEVVIEVVDPCGNADTCMVPVVINGNRPPVVTMPADMAITACTSEEFCLPGALVSDQDFDIDMISANIGRYDEANNLFCFTPDTSGVYTLILTATDSCGATDADTTVVTVDAPPIPVVDLGVDRTIADCEVGEICIDGITIEAEPQDIMISLGTWNPETGTICFTPDSSGRYELTVTVSDVCDRVVSETIYIDVTTGSAPVIADFDDITQYICYPTQICLEPTIYDPDNDIASITTSFGTYSDGKICFVPYSKGNYEIILTVTDTCGHVTVDTAMVTVETDQDITIGVPNDTTVFLCEPDTLCFPVDVPEGANVSVGGTNAFWNAETQTVCFYSDCCIENTLTVNVTTECGTYSESFHVTVQTNSAPLVTLPQDTTVFACDSVSLCFPVGISDIDGNIQSVEFDDNMSGFSYDAGASEFCLNTRGPGTHTLTVTVTDSCGAQRTAEMNVTVELNEAPEIVLAPYDSVNVQCSPEELCFDFTVSDPNADQLTVASDQGTIRDLGNGDYQLCITPETLNRSYFVEITATDSCGAQAQAYYGFAIHRAPSTSITCPVVEPAILCDSATLCLPVTIEGTDFTVTTSYGTWENGELCFLADTTGTYTIEIISEADCNSDTCLVTIPVEINDPVTITCPVEDTSVVTCYDSLLLAFPLQVTGMPDQMYAVGPDGTYIENDTLYYNADASGVYNFSVIVENLCNADTCMITADVQINEAPVLVLGPDTSLTACELPIFVQVPYEVVTVDDDIAEVRSSLGLVNDTSVNFTADTAGVYEMIVTATDDCGEVSEDTILITVTAGQTVTLDCPTDTVFASVQAPAEVRVPLNIQPTTATIEVSGGASYDTATGELVVAIADYGVSEYTVTATSDCNTEICTVIIKADEYFPPTVFCPDVVDTAICETDSTQTFCVPVTVSGEVTSVTVSPFGSYVDGQVCFPVDTLGEYTLQVIASNETDADTCEIVVIIHEPEPPVITLGDDFSEEICEPAEICFPLTVTPGSLPLEQVTVTGGTFDGEQVCFTADTGGVYEIIVSAWPFCGQVVKDTMIVTVTEGEMAMIDCPTDTVAVSANPPEEVRVPLGVTPVDASVEVSNGASYDAQTGELVIMVNELGISEFTVIASASCGADTCSIVIRSEEYFPPLVFCPDVVDTALCLSDTTQTVCVPITISGLVNNVVVSPIGEYVDGAVCIPVDSLGEYRIKVVASNATDADSCVVTLFNLDGAPPVVELPEDFAVAACAADEICVPMTITPGDYPLDVIDVTGGTYDGEQVCFTAETAGEYTVSVHVTDSCGNSVDASVTVTVDLNTPPVVMLPEDYDVFGCAGTDEVCVAVEVSDINLASVTSNLGTFADGEVCFAPDGSGIYELIVTAIDSCGSESADTVTITVDQNSAPTVDLLPSDTSVYLCYPGPICLDANVADIDGNIQSVSASRGTYNAETGQVCFVPYGQGEYQIILTVTDSCGLQAVDTATVTVTTDQNIALTCPEDTTVFLCSPDTIFIPLDAVTQNLPEGVQITVQGTNVRYNEETNVAWFYSDCCIQNKITVTATTECGSYSCDFMVYVQTNSKPLVTLPQDTTIIRCDGLDLCIPVGVNDIDGNLASVSANAPFVYDAGAGEVCFSPDTAGIYTITITATDSCGAVTTNDMVITIIDNTQPTVLLTVDSTTYHQCEFEEICLPFSVVDAEMNLANIELLNDGWTLNLEDSTICFTPTEFGEYCQYLVATDECGGDDTGVVCITVAPGDNVAIECPIDPILTVQLCSSDDVCLPLPITGAGYTVTTSFGTWAEGELCFTADTSGMYDITVIAESQCNTDTCYLQIPVTILPPAEITCPADTSMFLCGPGTYVGEFTISESITSVTTSAGVIEGNTITVPISTEGSYEITLTGAGLCDTVSCTFTITADFNSGPVVSNFTDTSLTLCALEEICLPFTVSDPDNNLDTVFVSNGGTVVDGQVCFTPTQYGSTVLQLTAVDSCGVATIATAQVTVTQGEFATIECPDNPFVSLCGPDRVCIPMTINPAGADITILPASLNGTYEEGEVCVDISQGGATTVTVIASSFCQTDTCEFTINVDMQQPPVISCPGEIDTLLCLSEPTELCFPVTIVQGTGVDINVNPIGSYAAGEVCLPIDTAGVYELAIIGFGACGADTCFTTVTVTADQEPEITLPPMATAERCPEDTEPICITGFSVSDLESDVTVDLACGPGTLDQELGELCFVPDTFGVYTFCIEATDGCNTVIEEYTVDVSLKNDCDVCVRFSFDAGECTPVGLPKRVALMTETNTEIGGYDLLISYDASALTFTGGTNDGTDAADWEYFTYSLGQGNCGAACPSGLVRFVGIADVNNGSEHPPESAYQPQGSLFFMDFLVANDQNLGDNFVPISFVWYDCGDNSVSSRSGDLLFIDLRIIGPENLLLWDETDNVAFPESNRPFGLGAPDPCLTSGDKGEPVRCIEFVNGGVCIIDPEDIDDRGDVNLNNLAYEIGDAVVFTNYFIRGLQAFTVSIPGQIASTDVNADGLTLTVADLSYLIRVVIGDAFPIPKINPHDQPLVVASEKFGSDIIVRTSSSHSIGVAHLVYEFDPSLEVSAPLLGNDASNMDLKYSIDGNTMKVLVFDIGSEMVPSGDNDLLRIPTAGTGEMRLMKAEFADYDGQPYTTASGSGLLPTNYGLEQNYPNPFNPSTTISFSLPTAQVWRLNIFNVKGEMVREYSGSAGGAGAVSVVWDGLSLSGDRVASGVYLYRLEAGSYKETKKMMLLK